jgi:DtxR family transcriptional regulator, Mn-dependent transcriptional regulator
MASLHLTDSHPAFEQYCMAIFELREDEIDVIQARIADRLGVSRPAVSEMIRRLEHEGLVTLSGTIQLTAEGLALAERVVRRHRLSERLLTDILGLSWALAHEEADKWEHVLSDEVEAQIVRLLDNPNTCPHGNPIPGTVYEPPDYVPLNKLAVGDRFTVSRIPEELEFTEGMLDFLEEAWMVPGREGQVTSTSPDGTVTVEVDGKTVGIGAFASARVLVLID